MIMDLVYRTFARTVHFMSLKRIKKKKKKKRGGWVGSQNAQVHPDPNFFINFLCFVLFVYR